jgi:hypothetical protein
MAPLGYRVRPGERIEIEVRQPNGARARIVGTLDKVPLAGGEALQLVAVAAAVESLPPRT